MTWKFKQIKPQKARGKFTEALWADPTYSAENKYDGDRRIAQFCGGRPRFTGTRQSVDGTGFVEKTANLPHLTKLPVLGLDGTVLDGEIVVPHGKKVLGGASKYVTAIMGSSPEEAVRKQREGGFLCYVVFDCLWYKGADVRGAYLHERRECVHDALQLWASSYVSQVRVHERESERRRAWMAAPEGLVFKHEDHTYGDEKLWIKLKKEATADVVVMGYKKGRGQFAGMVGSIIFGQRWPKRYGRDLAEMGAARGFDFAVMQALTNNPKHYLGKVFRIIHNGREPTGRFRHPRFDGWRDDKDPTDCIWNPEET